jgi:hypothetical protein
MEAETAKLQNALSKIANLHIQKYAQIIRNNATTKARIGYVPAAAQQAEKVAEQQAAQSASIATQTPVNQTTQTAANSAVNAVLKNLRGANYARNVLTKSNAYAALSNNNKNKVKQYINGKYPAKTMPIIGGKNGQTVMIIKNAPNQPWRFRKQNYTPYYLKGANTNNPEVYLTYGQGRNKFLGLF